jgi:hypothetical protein
MSNSTRTDSRPKAGSPVAAKPGRLGRSVRAKAGAGASWMALVAATTLGLGTVERVRTQVRVDRGQTGVEERGMYRLVVQSYQPETLGPDGMPSASERPITSTQRSVTFAELEAGVKVDVVSVGEPLLGRDAKIVAWVEPGAADLELDALTARPGKKALVGSSQSDSTAEIVLKQRA